MIRFQSHTLVTDRCVSYPDGRRDDRLLVVADGPLCELFQCGHDAAGFSISSGHPSAVLVGRLTVSAVPISSFLGLGGGADSGRSAWQREFGPETFHPPSDMGSYLGSTSWLAGHSDQGS